MFPASSESQFGPGWVVSLLPLLFCMSVCFVGRKERFNQDQADKFEGRHRGKRSLMEKPEGFT